MAALKSKDILNMSREEREKKMRELRFELVKSRANASKKGSKVNEIKKMLARMLAVRK